MFLHPRDGSGARASPFTPLLIVGIVVMALAAVVQTASGTTPLHGKPVIGKPVTAPVQPFAGKRFTVSFKVTRSDTGAPLIRGKMVCDPSVAGQVIRHAESFSGGTARLTFVVPANTAGKLLKVKLTIKAGGRSATRVAAFRVSGSSIPAVSIGDASIAEGNVGMTTLSFPVTLSTAATQTVSIAYATADGTAAAPSDYAAANGMLTFKPGEKAKAIQVSVVADLAIEQTETFTVTISNPVNATIANDTATGTIANDDTAVPVTSGAWKGATQNGNYVFFTVTPNRAITGFRVNDLPCSCDPYGSLTGGPDFGDWLVSIKADGTFMDDDSWTGSDWQGKMEWTYGYVKLTGRFDTATTATGTVIWNWELNYRGTHFKCTSGDVRWSATLLG